MSQIKVTYYKYKVHTVKHFSKKYKYNKKGKRRRISVYQAGNCEPAMSSAKNRAFWRRLERAYERGII